MTDQEPHSEPPRRRRLWLLYIVISSLALCLGLGVGIIGVAALSAFTSPPPPAAVETPTAVPSDDTFRNTPTPASGIPAPFLIGLSRPQASSVVQGLGLRLLDQGSEYSSAVVSDAVVRQSLSAGTYLEPGQSIAVVFSRGPERIATPNLVGKAADVAQRELTELGLRMTRTTQRVDDVPADVIFAQTPKAGADIERGGVITVTISLGPDQPMVPNVVGLQETVARQRLIAAGFSASLEANYQGHDTLDDSILRQVNVGCVLSTTPKGGDRVPRGTEVRLAVRKD